MTSPPESSKDEASLQVVGAGLMRTGTFSLHLALQRLLGGDCYHMKCVSNSPERIQFWLQALDKLPSDSDFRRHFQDFRAAVDFPVASFYQQLADVYPDAKIILTLRDPHEWFQSVSKTIAGNMKMRQSYPEDHPQRPHINMLEGVLQLTLGEYSFDDEESMVKAFNRHVEKVKKTVRPDRLLVFEVKDGWKPLCDFLNVPIPDEPFPMANTAEEFKTNFPVKK